MGIFRVMLALVCASSVASAQEATPTPAAAAAPKASPPRFIASVGVALPFYIYARPAGSASAMHFTPDERTSLAESISVGYIVNPKVSVLVSGLFLETLRADTDKAKTGFSFGGVAALVSYRFYKTMTFTAGPMYFYREYFLYENDLGALYSLAYAMPLPNKFAVSFNRNSPQSYFNKPVVAVTAGVNLARRF